jgi:hypothetical protein
MPALLGLRVLIASTRAYMQTSMAAIASVIRLPSPDMLCKIIPAIAGVVMKQ